MTEVVVVGKGPSVRGTKIGSWIDSFETVIKMSEGYFDEDYGFKCDYLILTTLQAWVLPKSINPQAAVWLYVTKRPRYNKLPWDAYNEVIKSELDYEGPIVFINEHIRGWLRWYRRHYNKDRVEKKYVKHPSKGTVAIITAMELLKAEKIFLVGFDRVMKGHPPLMETHDWTIENKMLKLASKHYSTELVVV